MTCRHAWLEVGHIGSVAITVECECGATAVVDRHGALLTGPFTQLSMLAPAGVQGVLFEFEAV